MNDCPCKDQPAPDAAAPAAAAPAAAASAPSRSGACPYCLRKHLLKALGYAEEVAEDSSREWERDRLLLNLLLAEDHAAALDEAGFKAIIREARLSVESGSDAVRAIRELFAHILSSKLLTTSK
ncbi:MAG: hypothetical protein IJL06_04940 [Kiritimatiellae bacterium]|nr:hypothetical protein [Kiritimatiellia bacterium]